MPIDYIDGDAYPDEDPNRIFHVVEEVEVYSESVALALDHIFNHIKLLSSFAAGRAFQPECDLLAKYPRYEISPEEEFEFAATSVLVDECTTLLTYFARIAGTRDEENQRRILAAMRDRIPFLNYRYPNDSFVLRIKPPTPKD